MSKNENGIVPHDGLSYDDYVEYGPKQPNAKPKCSDPGRVFLRTLHTSPKLDTMTNWCRDEDYKTSADPEKENYFTHKNENIRIQLFNTRKPPPLLFNLFFPNPTLMISSDILILILILVNLLTSPDNY